MQLWAIAANTYRENIRDRVLYSIVFFAVLVLCASLVMEEITIGDQDKVVRSVALGAIRAFGSVMSIFLGIGLVYKEIEKKTVYTIVSKPIARWMFVLGKYLGLMAVIAAQLALMALLYSGLGVRVLVDVDRGAGAAHGLGDPVLVVQRADHRGLVLHRRVCHRPPRR